MRGGAGAIATALCLLAAVLGFGMGREHSEAPSETAAIEAAAARYLDEAGATARAVDCQATPSAIEGIWIEVICARVDGARFVYPVGPSGAVDAPRLPET